MTWKLHVGDEVYDFDDPNKADIAAEILADADTGCDIWVEKPRALRTAELAQADAAFESWLEQDEKEE